MSTRVTAIVTTTYRYERPPRKRKAVALEVPAIVSRASKRSVSRETPPANDDHKPAIITIRRKGRADVLD